MSKYVVATGFGGPENLSVRESDLREPGPGEVLVAVRAAGVNPVDHERYAAGGSEELPIRLGFEVSGVVVGVGADAVGPAGGIDVGDEVVCFRVQGGYAERLVVPASTVLPKPEIMSHEEAAGLLLAGTTAVQALTAVDVRTGDVVLVHGAAGGVGLMTVQLARARGAHVIGTASAGSHGLLQRYGVTPVEYGDDLVERVRELDEDVDAALDLIGTDEAIDASLDLVTDRARIATIVAFERAQEVGIKALGGAPGAEPGIELRDAARLELITLVEESQLEVTVDSTYTLADVAEAHRALQEGHTHGKIVLLP